MANFLPPVNGASLGSYFCVKNLTSAWNHCLNKPISSFFEEAHTAKMVENTGQATHGPEIFECIVTDRQTNSLALYTGRGVYRNL